jgi:hypothetical protein
MQLSITYDEIIIYRLGPCIQFNGIYGILLRFIVIPLDEYVLNFERSHVIVRPPLKTMNSILFILALMSVLVLRCLPISNPIPHRIKIPASMHLISINVASIFLWVPSRWYRREITRTHDPLPNMINTMI